ncbi:porin family protein [Thiohalophilus thiocyanatoxydans]|uniref:Uncharacterized protein n=1 Tax=Thiohalophilus thiocyanatoxydans TaxID=381308 RepID=A0A4R8J193_9GAMM|nr:hypothetical protein [Thiohalophilus thiocyanatoxydans]TDY04077.1 hypothetical protein EDC23_0449 [Thiohalophilus thiocyanatoxydans]
MLKIRTFIAGLLAFIVFPSLVTGPVLAGEQGNGYLPQFRLHMDQNARDSLPGVTDFEQEPILVPRLNSFDPADPVTESRRPAQSVQQYDARLFYPVSGIHGMSLDLGVNIKYLNGVGRSSRDGGAMAIHNFNQAIPMFHATALFDLPFDGLSASLEGSHRDTEQTHAFDYKAKLEYKWNRGLGLEGGWRHQQYSLEAEQTATRLDYESRGLFLDLFMDF